MIRGEIRPVRLLSSEELTRKRLAELEMTYEERAERRHKDSTK